MERFDPSLCELKFGLLCMMSGASCAIAGLVILLLG
jgi:hypothetical protein